MNCPLPEDWIAFYGGEVGEDAVSPMAEHLDGCRGCQDEFDRLCRLGAGIRGAIGRRPRPMRRRGIARPTVSKAPLAAAALFVAALGLVFALRRPPPTPVEPPVAAAPVGPATVEPPPSPPPPPPPAPKEATPEFEIPLRPPAPPPPPPPVEPAAPAPPSAPEPEPQRKSAVAIASFDQGGASRPLLGGQSVGGRGIVRFPDGTRLELSDKTALARIDDRPSGKWIELTEGALAVEAAHQPEGRPLVLATPHGEARVVGTTLRLTVDADATRLEVAEGKVQLSRPGGGTVDVLGGFAAVAAPGVELAARPLPRMLVEPVHRFDFEDGRLPKSFDTGTVQKGPDGRSCVGGEGPVKLSDDARGLFTYSDDLYLSFDYWADPAVRTLDLHVWSREKQVTFGTTIWNTPNGRWTHVVLPLSDFLRTEPGRLLRLRPGEAVPNLWVAAGQPGAKVYFDNLELARVRPPPPRKKP